MTQEHRLWASGEAYEPFVGRWSRLVAPEFVRWLTPAAGKDWVDVGCGSGELSRAILKWAAPSSVRGVDPSGVLAYAQQHILDERATFTSGDAQALPLEDDSADFVVAGLVLNFVPDAAAGIAEWVRVVRTGGTVAAYVWDYAGEMQMLRHFWDAAAELDARARDLDEGRRRSFCNPDGLVALLTGAGLRDVDARAIDVPTVFADFDDYWTPFLAGQAPAPRYAMSLSEERRGELRELIRARLPIAADGSIALIARAWAVKGIR